MPPQSADTELLLGQLLRQRGCLTEGQLAQALDEQTQQAASEAPPALGEICARHGWCTMHDVADTLVHQQEAVFQDTTLGHLLVSGGRLTLGQLEDALGAQRKLGTRLGEILISKAYCSREEVDAAIDLQAGRRNSALRHLTAFAFHTFNVVEIIVNQELDEILREEAGCTCDECRANALALALNSLPPRYVSDHRLLMLFVERFRAESLDLIRERIRVAVRRVKEHPKSTHRATC